MRADRLLAGVAALPVAAALLGVHPALRGEGALATTGRDLAGGGAAWLRGVGMLGAYDEGAPAAVAVLAASVLVASALGLSRLAGPGVVPGGAGGAAVPGSAGPPAAALAGHGLGCYPGAATGGAAWVYVSTGLAILLVRPLAGGAGEVAPSRKPRPAAARAAAMLLLAALAVLSAGLADGLLQALAGTWAFPEAWFVVAVESGAGWFRFEVIGILVALLAGALHLERASDRRGHGGGLGLLVAAPCWALLLGPSNPCRALALAFALRCLGRAGVPAPVRAGFAVLLVLGMAALVHAI